MTKAGYNKMYADAIKELTRIVNLMYSHIDTINVTPNDIRNILSWIEEVNLLLLQAGNNLSWKRQTHLLSYRTKLAIIVERYYNQKSFQLCEALIGLPSNYIEEALSDAETHGIDYRKYKGLYWIER